MKAFLLAAVAAFCLSSLAEPNVTNTVMMIDQNGKMNVAGVASVSDVATNAVRVQLAEAKADAAQTTARGVTNQLNGIVANIMSNNVVIYRSGYTDAFEGLVVYTTNDTLTICNYQKVSLAGGVLRARIDYVSSVNLGVSKPSAYAHDTLADGKEDFDKVPSADITVPVIHNEPKTIGGTTYDKWYEIYVDVDVAGEPSQYFYFIKLEADTPSGDGAALELPNGVSGGITGTYIFGDKSLDFKGGVLRSVRDAN